MPKRYIVEVKEEVCRYVVVEAHSVDHAEEWADIDAESSMHYLSLDDAKHIETCNTEVMSEVAARNALGLDFATKLLRSSIHPPDVILDEDGEEK